MPDGSNNFDLNTNNHNDLNAAAEKAINKITTGEELLSNLVFEDFHAAA